MRGDRNLPCQSWVAWPVPAGIAYALSQAGYVPHAGLAGWLRLIIWLALIGLLGTGVHPGCLRALSGRIIAGQLAGRGHARMTLPRFAYRSPCAQGRPTDLAELG